MKLKWIVPPTLVVAMAFTGSGVVKAHAAPSAADLASAQDRDRGYWDQAPAGQAQRRGFHDGVEAARHDFDHHRRGDADDHDSYRHPPVSHDQREDYREGFRRGYERAMEHMNGEHNRY